jgi:5-methylcytosine-specific restriction protein A
MTDRIRGRKLQALRQRLLRASPLCVTCQAKGIVRVATQLDHITALVNGGTNEDGNFQGLCHDCHADKTATDLGYRRRSAIGLDGWPIIN